MFGTVNPTASALLPGPILHRDEFLTGLHHVFSLIFLALLPIERIAAPRKAVA